MRVAQPVKAVLGHDLLRKPVAIARLENKMFCESSGIAADEFDMLVG